MEATHRPKDGAPLKPAATSDASSHSPPPPPYHVRAFALLTWASCSIAIVLFNKLVLSQAGFDFPIALTWFHTAANSVVMFLVFECAQQLPSPYRQSGAAANMAAVAPVAALFAVATILRNAAFMYLPVATIQLLSSGTPVLIYLMSCATQLDAFRPSLGAAVLVIAGGCAWATSESVAALASSSWRGVACQVGGLTLEALRSVLLKKVMVRLGPTHSSLSLLYMVAPAACAMLALPALTTEMPAAAAFIANGDTAFRALLCVNVVMAVCLNLSSFFFIKACAVTTTSVTALAKDGVIILGSYMVQPGAEASGRVLAGYGVTLAGTVACMGLQQQR